MAPTSPTGSSRSAATNSQIAQQGQVTERFTRAIDQLGKAELDVRLGGIYALERIANLDSREPAWEVSSGGTKDLKRLVTRDVVVSGVRRLNRFT